MDGMVRLMGYEYMVFWLRGLSRTRHVPRPQLSTHFGGIIKTTEDHSPKGTAPRRTVAKLSVALLLSNTTILGMYTVRLHSWI